MTSALAWAGWVYVTDRRHDAALNQHEISGMGAGIDPGDLLRFRTSRGLRRAVGTIESIPLEQLGEPAKRAIVELSQASSVWRRTRGRDQHRTNPFRDGTDLHQRFEQSRRRGRKAMNVLGQDTRDALDRLAGDIVYPSGKPKL